MDWHDPTIWGGSVPANGSSVTLPANTQVLISSCSIDPTFVFGLITVPFGSSLIFGDAPITFQAHGIQVVGALAIGSPTCRLQNKISITLYGSRNAQALPAATYVKGISVFGKVDIHAVEYFPTWTRLAATAYPGDSTIFIQDCPNWQSGQSIVISTTELKDSRDWHRNEEVQIESVLMTTISSSTCAITLTAPLLYQHYGGFEYQAEVALLSRNILIQGDPFNSEPTDISPISCTYGSSPSTYPCDNTFLTGFGAHVIVVAGATVGRFSGVELFRAGQTNVLGRYPIHFHLLGNITTPNNFFVSDCSVHHSFFRCCSIHGSSGTTLENGISLVKNTGYDIIGNCFFASEDGIEENNTIAYNFAAHIHPLGPFWQASYGVSIGSEVMSNSNGAQSFYSQYTDYITSNPALIRVDDYSASPFYFTNPYNSIYGNAASGGWAGFSFVNLPAPVGFSSDINNFVPQNRPLILFQGNSAHSTGYWQSHAAGVYVGGNLVLNAASQQVYTAGRYIPRDTCSISSYGSSENPNSCPSSNQVWLQFLDTKVFLANAGLQSWGDREEIIRFEVHDVGISTNVFGQVWIDQMLVNCRSANNVTYLQNCNTTSWWTCNARDLAFFESYIGFQFYDTGQSHLVTDSIFQNCVETNPNCLYGTCTMTLFSYLTHSDEFTPGLMQMTKNISYINSDMSHIMTPSFIPFPHITVSGRDGNWLDVDGTVNGLFPKGTKVNIGSNWTGADWWRYNDQCVNTLNDWVCPMGPGDDRVSICIHWASAEMEAEIGTDYCSNGEVSLSATTSGYLPCPIGAVVTHFNRNEANAYPVALSPRVTGPVISECGGWFVRYLGGTPNHITFTDMQIDHDTILHLAIPYPAGTTFKIYAQAPVWCYPGTPPYEPWDSICQHFYHPVNSIQEVRDSWGDTYFFDSSTQLLHIRIVSLDSFTYEFATNATYNPSAVWNSSSTWSTYFSRDGLNLLVTGSTLWSVVINTTSANCNPRCPDLPGVSVPGINGSSDYTGPPQTLNFTERGFITGGTNTIFGGVIGVLGCFLLLAWTEIICG